MQASLNRMVAGNTLKSLVIDTDMGRLIGYAEVTSLGTSDDSVLFKSIQLTMTDPQWSTVDPNILSLEPTITSGVVFGAGKGVVFGASKNLLAPIAGAQSANGITAQIAASGLITLGGTATADTTLTIPCKPISLANGTVYTASLTVKSGTASGTISASVSGFSALTTAAPASTATATGQSVSSVAITVPSGTVLSQYVFGIQVEPSSTATSWMTAGAVNGVIFYPATGETGTITNTGNVDAYPVITIVGSCTNPSIKNKTTGETIAVNAVLGSKDTLVIDCRPATRGCYLNGALTFGIKQGLGWMHCPPGDNVMTFDRTGYDTKRHCTIALQGRYL